MSGIPQLLVNGLVSGLIVALPAVALALTYSVLKFSNFAIGSQLTMGAYLAFIFNVRLGWPLAAAALMAAVLSAGLAMAVDWLALRPLRDRSPVTLLVASMGVAFVLENLCRFAFGNGVLSYDVPVARPLQVAGLRVNREQLIATISVLGALVAVQGLLFATPLGRAMRAVADNPLLAAVRGIHRQRVITWCWAVVGGLTALGGVLIGMDRAIDPMLGWNYVISVFAAAILGGFGNPLGAALGALGVGVIEELATVVVPASYRTGVAFAAIALLLLLRPQGLAGVRGIKR
ncbi:branched-chain amino acid ABC transporter permease [Stigmatella erecta]|uniref:Branched-chain amino acid transport system permease protein/neutral amino acid transport system permease protein n=1 Tax=Stigmatella erecta TaxID=83460 RepID=A0A1I0L8P7_9BACT|nr:branched-chain amino acid ABC transporter permease [Stigmatella erecta]SEU35726.1 branched-chain amino acid transport system permease protein/neutral amino acid transport system permease protein [Stigmatella erecta]